jgi:uncharacterized DUF497 family protein
MKFAGFDWDAGNIEKCQKHGVSIEEIEWVLRHPFAYIKDVLHSDVEDRLNAIGSTLEGRSLFVVFTVRVRNGLNYVRPISARYMHRKEMIYYEETLSKLQDR